MKLDYKRIVLFGKFLFEMAVIEPAFKKPNPMPNEACFLHVREGGYNSVSEEAFLTIYKGQSVLMKCGNYLSQMIPDQQTGKYEAVAVHFHPDVLKKIYANDLPSFLTEKRALVKSQMALIHASAAVDKYVEDILFYFDHRQLANEDILMLKVKEIILLLMQTKDAPNVQQILENLFSERTVSFREIIEAHLFSDLSTTELAQLTNMSLSSFKRKFQKIYQVTPRVYIFKRRLVKAKELLTLSDYSISDIAYDCGFRSISHFSKKFKEYTNLSPTEFRLNHSEK